MDKDSASKRPVAGKPPEGRLGGLKMAGGDDDAGPSSSAAKLGGSKMRFRPTAPAARRKPVQPKDEGQEPGPSASGAGTLPISSSNEEVFKHLKARAEEQDKGINRAGPVKRTGQGGRDGFAVTSFFTGDQSAKATRAVKRGPSGSGTGEGSGAGRQGGTSVRKAPDGTLAFREGHDGPMDSDAEDEGQEAYADVGPNAPITLPLVPPGERPPRAKGKPTFPELEPMVDALPQDAARGLGLGNARSEDDVGELFLVQMPEILPAYLPTKDPGGSAGASEAGPAPVRGRGIPVRMETAPKSRLGTLVEYSDGTVGLRVGDVELEVSPATLSGVQQEAVTFSVEDHVCLFLGDVKKHIVVTPPVETLLQSL